ncbi:sucrose-6-phosphate hydrolase [Vibrio mediterranei]|nr:sucrose-6-phosphate hydrolase [Vibrio mediterranei]
MTDTQYFLQTIQSLLNAPKQGEHDPYRPVWHFAPRVGLLNDPNGLSFFNGEYHLFYQWNPLKCEHGAKAWGLATSPDLIHWQHKPLALAPTEDYETSGCYSGSAIEVDGKLELFYTGNVKYPQGGRTAYQCRAQLDEQGMVTKLGPVLSLPEGYSGHVRDPKVWKRGKHYYMVLGAEDLQQRGVVILYRSTDLHQWEKCGDIYGTDINGKQDANFMLECPDLFALDGRDVMITCPKTWIDIEGKATETFDVEVTLGELDYHQAIYNATGSRLMDHGFDFYAPQTFEDNKGRRILFGWMGKPDEFEPYQPTIEYGWIHQMTCPRRLTILNGELLQQPVEELATLRCNPLSGTCLSTSLVGLSAELLLQDIDGATIAIELSDDLSLLVTPSSITTRRKNLKTGLWEDRAWQGKVSSLQLMRDHSCVEVFINDGKAVMTSRFFGQANSSELQCGFRFESDKAVNYQHWTLEI